MFFLRFLNPAAHCAAFLAQAMLLSSCLTIYSGPNEEIDAEDPEETICESLSGVVTAAYVTNGSNWNDYVENDNDNGGTAFYNQDDEACTTVTGGNEKCIHAGEVRKVIVTGQSSCAGLSIEDDLSAFVWKCYVVSGVATFYSVRLADDKGLSDLIDWDATTVDFKSNKVTISKTGQACPLLQSVSQNWWRNDFSEVSMNAANTQTLTNVDVTDAIGTIHYVALSGASSGFDLNDSKVAFVVREGQTLSYGTGDTNNCLTTRECLIFADSNHFLWVEGTLDGNGVVDAYENYFTNSDYLRVHKTTVINNENIGLDITATSTNPKITFSNFVSTGNVAGGHYGIAVAGEGAHLYSVRAHNNGDFGIFLLGTLARVQKVNSSNNAAAGFYLQTGASNAVISEIVVAHTSGISANAPSFGTWNHVTAVTASGSSSIGIGNAAGADHRLSNIFVTSGTTGGLQFYWSGSQLSHFAGALNQVLHLSVADSDNNSFYGDFILGGTPSCFLAAGAVTTTLDGTCNHGTAAGTAPLTTTADFSTAIVGKVLSDNTNALDDVNGLADYDTELARNVGVASWVDFDNWYRTWGKYSINAFPSTSLRGPCVAATSCQLWDFRLAAGDTTGMLEAHGSATAGATCPASINGSPADTQEVVMTNSHSVSPSTYLVNAVEIWGDAIGDDDGLCEDDEACIYQPNIGAFLGEGDYLGQTCVVTQAGFTDVTMYFYERSFGQ